MFDACTTGDMAHIDTIFKFLPHTRQHVDACDANTSSCQEIFFFSFRMAVKNSTKVGPLVFLL